MADASGRVRGDWTQFESAGANLEKRADAIGLSREALQAEIEPIELAAERGCVEYKRRVADEAFRLLDDARYRSLNAQQMGRIAERFAILSYVNTVQRYIATGDIRVRAPAAQTEEPVVIDPDREIDVKSIIADIQTRVKEDAALRNRQQVKNILLGLTRYNREMEQLKEVTARTPQDKRGPIVANFRRTTDEIFAAIRKNYADMEREDAEASRAAPRHILQRIPIDTLSGHYLKQARQAMEVRSGVLHARDEGYGTREALIALSEHHDAYIKLVEEEFARYREMGGTDRVAFEIALSFAAEIRKRIERETEVY
ncbi:MAG: hypothetical protein EA382_15290 [Spirochaetaceae bacterium]|nr:MAG: hypothetical protein EA382_15290 [Spirochaetaceae bacterium]